MCKEPGMDTAGALRPLPLLVTMVTNVKAPVVRLDPAPSPGSMLLTKTWKVTSQRQQKQLLS